MFNCNLNYHALPPVETTTITDQPYNDLQTNKSIHINALYKRLETNDTKTTERLHK